jgi:ABC-2 type transport system permease protein
MAVWVLAKKEVRLLLRDRLAAVILLLMPLLFILILGLLLGEGFGQKPDERLRVSLVDLDRGLPADRPRAFPPEAWAKVVQRDLAETAGIRVEIIPTGEQAQALCRDGKRAAVLVFQPDFSERVSQCSFLVDGINPFYRDGVKLQEVGAELLTDPTQMAASSIIEQVAQVSLMRVILPYMIGEAFAKLSSPSFMTMLADAVPGSVLIPRQVKEKLGPGIKEALKKLFIKYDLTGRTWADLTKAGPRQGTGAAPTVYANEDGTGLLRRGAVRYQVLVPSYTVMFAFSLVLTVGWLFVTERQQGTLKRLRAAPLTRSQLLLGKLLPCFALSVAQGAFLLAAGKLVFGMRWGPEPWAWWEQALWLLPVVLATSLAAMGLALLVAAVARTEIQVAIGGTLVVLVLALVSGCLIPRELMPERTQQLTFVTPHAWALSAYRQLLLSPDPNLTAVVQSCAVLAAFGAGFFALAWGMLRLE